MLIVGKVAKSDAEAQLIKCYLCHTLGPDKAKVEPKKT
jgi:hypothetical protein